MFRRLADLDLSGARVLVRVDFNVPLDADLRVTSDARIRAALPTIRAILEAGGKPVLMSHLGRPKGQVVETMRLRPAADRLAELVGVPVTCAPDCVGQEAEAAAAKLEPGECLVLENLRFHPGETAGDDEFAASLARLGDVYVNDAFGTAHRAHASVAGVPKLLPAAAGLLMERELEAFERVLTEPERPFMAILGGAKVSDKLPVIQSLLEKVDVLAIGGAMAYTFLEQAGTPIGASRCEPDLVEEAGRVVERAAERGVQLLLPDDHICASELAEGVDVSTHGPGIPEGQMGLDLGPRSVERYAAAIAKAGTMVWNGPMGVFEIEAFRSGTEAVARAVADSNGWSMVGGGDSVAAVELVGVADRIGHVSTGGGASLELLEGKALPGITALEK